LIFYFFVGTLSDRFPIFNGKNINACINDCTLVKIAKDQDQTRLSGRKRVHENANELEFRELGNDMRFCIACHVVATTFFHCFFWSFSFVPSFQFIVITDMMMIKA